MEEGLTKCPTVKVDEGDLPLLCVSPLAVEKPVKMCNIDPKYDQKGDP